ncbi:MAG: ATP-binding protein [Bryobacterales bacterium]|nr:ATP-binding protein [Bryobacterales bacterium]
MQSSGANFAAWFESAYQADTARLPGYYQRLKQLIPGFRSINWKQQYHAEKVIEVEFMRNGRRDSFQLSELSTGELSLLIHYAILHFGVERHTTLALDEPDNFLSLSEVEPLIYAIEEEVERANAQVFLISHHPEFFDRWAKDPSRARYFERTEQGMFRLKEIDWSRSPGLAPSELIARGWQDA